MVDRDQLLDDKTYANNQVYTREDSMNCSELSYYYVINMAKSKGYNLQSIAIKKFCAGIDKQKFLKDLHKDLSEFNAIYTPYLSRDIVFKANSLETRKSLLISPAHYFYYTKLVLEIVLDNCNETILRYDRDGITAFYSGVLFKSLQDIDKPKEILFNNSYNSFQEELLKFTRQQAMGLDLSNFFDSINVRDLIEKLYSKYNEVKVQSLDEFFKVFELTTLPQFHNSIASSILSQEYLSSFDIKMQTLLKKENLELVRFVDDMYLFNNGFPKSEKGFREILDSINSLLWKDKLNLNTNKIELYVENELFSRELAEVEYDESDFRVVKEIDEKASSLTDGVFYKFVKDINELYYKSGYDVNKFSEKFENTFSVKDGEAKKVLNNFVFGGKWKNLKDSVLRYIVLNYQFVFFKPDIFLILYLKIYDYVEFKFGRNEKTIREFLDQIDANSSNSLRYLYTSLAYLIQRNFKRRMSLNQLNNFNEQITTFINRYIK